MYWYKRFGTTDLPTDRPDQDFSTGDNFNADFIPLPGGGLFDTRGSDLADPSGMKISVSGAISTKAQSTTALEAQLYALQALVGKRDVLYRQRDIGLTWEWAYARLTKLKTRRSKQNVNFIDLDFDFQVEDRCWNGANHDNGWLFDSGEYFDTGLFFDSADFTFTLDASPKTVTVTNGGTTVIVTDCIITVSAIGADITALQIEKLVSAAAVVDVSYAGTITAGQALVIDCGADSVKNNAVADYNSFSRGAGHKQDSILPLDPGDNSIRITKTGGGAASTINFSFNDGYR